MAMKKQELDFGWSHVWMNAYWIFGTGVLAGALILFLQFGSPSLQILSFPLFLYSANLYAGNLVWRTSKKTDYMTLPFVDLFSSDSDLILDAGCGSGRTTIALSRVMKKGRIVALDRFDSAYIQDGGMSLLKKNLGIAGISSKVQIEKGDVTRMEFNDGTFNAAASAYMLDHIGKQKLAGLKEIYRVLKPGGKFLLIVIVPGWTTFAVANLFCLTRTSRKGWRMLLEKAGFRLCDVGIINTGAYFLAQK